MDKDYDIFLDVIKEVDKFKDINDFEKLPDEFCLNLTNNCVSIIKQFLDLFKINIDSDERQKKYKCFVLSFLFNWMLTHHVKLNLFIKEHPKFREQTINKLEELRNESCLVGFKYWKGVDIYKKYLIK